jgi:hypothetical protein
MLADKVLAILLALTARILPLALSLTAVLLPLALALAHIHAVAVGHAILQTGHAILPRPLQILASISAP